LAPKKKYSEEELVQHLLSHDAKRFEALYDHFSPALYGVVKKIVKHEELAEDILQDGFLKIWNNAPHYEPKKARLFTWMLNIMRNTAIDYLRSKQGKTDKKNLPVEALAAMDMPRLTMDSDYGNIGIKKMVGQLNKDHHEITNLAFFEGYTQDEISKKLQIPLGTVKTRCRTALQILRRAVSEN
jgi:RNA polymerase sigma factor (sigma-70 family)